MIRRLIPAWLKNAIRGRAIPESTDTQESRARREVFVDLEKFANSSRLRIAPAKSQEPDESAPFKDFFARFNLLVDNQDEEMIRRISDEYPCLSSVVVKAREYLGFCDLIEPPVSDLLRRLYFQNLPYLNSSQTWKLLNYRKSLPKVGLLYYPNPENRDFLVDALQGKFFVDVLEPGELLTRVWNGRECDYSSYTRILRETIESSLSHLPEEFWRHFPERESFLAEVTHHAQFQMAFTKLLDENTWDLIFVGAMETSLGYTLYDYPKEKRPPVFYFHHGLLFSEPLSDLFLEADKYIASGSVERNYFLNLGIDDKEIIRIGSIERESIPSLDWLKQKRASVRGELGIEEDAKVILYGLTMDIYLYKKRPCDELTELLTESFLKLVTEHGVKNLHIFLKYHPSPRSDPNFSFSRQQMPLEQFWKTLEPLGCRIYLVPEVSPYIYAADCFIAHESATIMSAVERGCPTLSLAFHDRTTQPLLGWETYRGDNICHRLVSDNESPDAVAKNIKQVLDSDKEVAWQEAREIWQRVFGLGRTASLVTLAESVEQILAQPKSPPRS